MKMVTKPVGNLLRSMADQIDPPNAQPAITKRIQVTQPQRAEIRRQGRPRNNWQPATPPQPRMNGSQITEVINLIVEEKSLVLSDAQRDAIWKIIVLCRGTEEKTQEVYGCVLVILWCWGLLPHDPMLGGAA